MLEIHSGWGIWLGVVQRSQTTLATCASRTIWHMQLFHDSRKEARWVVPSPALHDDHAPVRILSLKTGSEKNSAYGPTELLWRLRDGPTYQPSKDFAGIEMQEK
eukprot:2839286-Amphidinium_carterae.1